MWVGVYCGGGLCVCVCVTVFGFRRGAQLPSACSRWPCGLTLCHMRIPYPGLNKTKHGALQVAQRWVFMLEHERALAFLWWPHLCL